MKKIPFLLASVGVPLGCAGLTEPTAAQGAKTSLEVTLSAAAKKSTPARQRGEQGQIACTVAGCHAIPPGCHPQIGYNWDGLPTGFDIVVCAPRGRGR